MMDGGTAVARLPPIPLAKLRRQPPCHSLKVPLRGEVTVPYIHGTNSPGNTLAEPLHQVIATVSRGRRDIRMQFFLRA